VPQPTVGTLPRAVRLKSVPHVVILAGPLRAAVSRAGPTTFLEASCTPAVWPDSGVRAHSTARCDSGHRALRHPSRQPPDASSRRRKSTDCTTATTARPHSHDSPLSLPRTSRKEDGGWRSLRCRRSHSLAAGSLGRPSAPAPRIVRKLDRANYSERSLRRNWKRARHGAAAICWQRSAELGSKLGANNARTPGKTS
jgi:hypothetical protein